MRFLLDTNVVLRAVNPEDKQYALASGAVQTLSTQGHELIIVPQVIYEFWSAASRPAKVNGLGWSPPTVRTVIDDFVAEWTLLEDKPDIFSFWLELVTTQQVSGKQVHDARLAAAVKAHDVDNLLTLNGDDFNRFGVRVVHPRDVTE